MTTVLIERFRLGHDEPEQACRRAGGDQPDHVHTIVSELAQAALRDTSSMVTIVRSLFCAPSPTGGPGRSLG